MDRYVYLLLDGDSPFYAGKGTHRTEYLDKYRRPHDHLREALLPTSDQKNPLKCAYINHIILAGRAVQVQIVHDALTEDDAVNIETNLIQFHGRIYDGGILTNLVTEQSKIAHESRSKAVYSFNLEGQLIGSYGSIKKAAIEVGCSSGSIVSCCKGLYKTAGGRVWSYTNEFPGFKAHIPWNKRKIDCYQLDGTFIQTHESSIDASKWCGIAPGLINACVSGKTSTAGGFVWVKHKDLFKLPFSKPTGRPKRAVQQFNIDGDVINTYDSITEAATSNNMHFASIQRCCTGKGKTAGGFVWSYTNIVTEIDACMI